MGVDTTLSNQEAPHSHDMRRAPSPVIQIAAPIANQSAERRRRSAATSEDGEHRDTEKAWDRLYTKGLVLAAEQQLKHEHRLLEERRLKEQQEAEELTFHPRINLTSSSITEHSWRIDPQAACDRLYDLARHRLSAQTRQSNERVEAELLRIEAERADLKRYMRHGETPSPKKSTEELQHVFDRLSRPSSRAGSISERRHQELLQSREHQHKPRLAAATNRLYELSKKRNEAQVLQAKEEAEKLKIEEARADRAKKVLKSRGGPTCVSGNANCQCPEHRHAKPSSQPISSRGRVPSADPNRPRSREVSPRLLAIPVHRLQSEDRPSSARAPQKRTGWPADAGVFAFLSTKTPNSGQLKEPTGDRLTLEELSRHEALLRSATP